MAVSIEIESPNVRFEVIRRKRTKMRVSVTTRPALALASEVVSDYTPTNLHKWNRIGSINERGRIVLTIAGEHFYTKPGPRETQKWNELVVRTGDPGKAIATFLFYDTDTDSDNLMTLKIWKNKGK